MRLLIILLSFILLTLQSFNLVFAKNINLYDQPKIDAKTVGTLDLEKGFIPIFSPKDSTWLKVANPENGAVGWIKSSDLSVSDAKNMGFSFRIMNTGVGPESYHIIQFSGPSSISNEQGQKILKEMQLRQEQLGRDMQKMMNDMFGNFKNNIWPDFTNKPEDKTTISPKDSKESTK